MPLRRKELDKWMEQVDDEVIRDGARFIRELICCDFLDQKSLPINTLVLFYDGSGLCRSQIIIVQA